MASDRVSSSSFVNLLPSAPEASAAWNTCLAHLIEPPAYIAGGYSDHVLALRMKGNCRVHRQVQGRSSDGSLGPGGIILFPAGFDFVWETDAHRGPIGSIAVFIPRDYMARVIEQNFRQNPAGVELVDRFIIFDPVIESVLKRLTNEVRNGSPSGSLYAKSACEFLAHHLVYAHSSLTAVPVQHACGLPARRLKLVLDHIEDNIGQPIALRPLAELGGVSPRHFERAFRQALDMPPHAYVLQKRVAAAPFAPAPARAHRERNRRACRLQQFQPSCRRIPTADRILAAHVPTALRRQQAPGRPTRLSTLYNDEGDGSKQKYHFTVEPLASVQKDGRGWSQLA